MKQGMVILATVLHLAVTAGAQVFTGRIDVTVIDSSGDVLPGVTVEVKGPLTQTAVTDSQGQVHLLNLASGTYQLRASLKGFSDYLNRGLPVSAGTSLPLKITLGIQGVQEQVQVSSEVPIIDPGRQAISTNAGRPELQHVPTARDPWVVLRSIPGVMVEGVNVGGSASGQQPKYVAKGAPAGDNTWYLEGVPITDMTGLGSSPSYYDFDAFQEMQVATGGSDARLATPGVHTNIVLRSGANTLHGSARLFFENENLQGNNLTIELHEALRGVSPRGNRVTRHADYGAEAGGPLIRDRWWAWGAFGRTEVDVQTLDGFPDETRLAALSARTQYAFSHAWRGNFAVLAGDKEKDGRGAGPFNPPATTWVQDGTSRIYKGEANGAIGNALFVAARAAHVNGPFTLTPKGGLDNGQVFIDADGVYHNSNVFEIVDRPQVVFNGDASWFRGRHELRVGASARRFTDDQTTRYAGDFLGIQLDRTGASVAIAIRPYRQVNRAFYTSMYLGDTFTMDRLTLNASLRFDRASGSADAVTVQAHPVVPGVLPGVSAPAVKNAIVWNTPSPRGGLAYVLGAERRTVARASYAAFASQLAAPLAGSISSAGFASAYYLAVDRNRNFNIEPGELGRFLFAKNINPADPSKPVNQIDPDYGAPRTHEVVLGVDRELFSGFAMSAAYTWRRYVNQQWNQAPPIGVTSADYVEDGRLSGTLPDGTSYIVPYYALRAGRAPAGAGTLTANRDGYHRTYNGLELAAAKRLRNNWMARFGFSWNRSREYFDDPSTSIVDPTPTTVDPQVNGGLMPVPGYQFIANGFYQWRWGINIGGSFLLRQGDGRMFYSSDVPTNDPVYATKDVLLNAGRIGESRLPTIKSLDARIEKSLTFDRATLTFDFDVFNLFNHGFVLGRVNDVSASSFNRVTEVMSPRIARFGVRVQF